jgi:hypothetical protein
VEEELLAICRTILINGLIPIPPAMNTARWRPRGDRTGGHVKEPPTRMARGVVRRDGAGVVVR